MDDILNSGKEFKVVDPLKKNLLAKYIYWKNGISTKDFDKEKWSDVLAMVEIDDTFHTRQIKLAEVQSALVKAKNMSI